MRTWRGRNRGPLVLSAIVIIALFSCEDLWHTLNNRPPSAPALLAPGNGAEGVEVKPTFEWRESSDADGDTVHYDLYLGKPSNPATVIASELGATTYTIGVDALDPDTVYYWKVIAKDGYGGRTASDVWSFTTAASASIGSLSLVVDLSRYSPGDKQTFQAGRVRFRMVYVPAKKYPAGEADDTIREVKDPFWAGEEEMTYGLWHAVYAWATDDARAANRYYFMNAGRSGSGKSVGDQQPVTTVNWRDAMVWCNAATEWYNARLGTDYTCVYKTSGAPIRDSRTANQTACDAVTPDTAATGFRLLSGDEWELAARYIRDGDKDGDILDEGEYYPGDYASGADADYTVAKNAADFDGDGDADCTTDVAVFADNSGASTAVVMSRHGNALGMYDMSGNVWEWCFDAKGSNRLIRGGYWGRTADHVLVSSWKEVSPADGNDTVGVRLGRSQR